MISCNEDKSTENLGQPCHIQKLNKYNSGDKFDLIEWCIRKRDNDLYVI